MAASIRRSAFGMFFSVGHESFVNFRFSEIDLSASRRKFATVHFWPAILDDFEVVMRARLIGNDFRHRMILPEITQSSILR